MERIILYENIKGLALVGSGYDKDMYMYMLEERNVVCFKS